MGLAVFWSSKKSLINSVMLLKIMLLKKSLMLLNNSLMLLRIMLLKKSLRVKLASLISRLLEVVLMTAIVEDTTMDVVLRPLMFEDECILVAPHGKWGEHELDYLVRDLALHPNPKEVVDDKYVSKEQRNFIRKSRKVKVKLHQQKKKNKHGPFSKKSKMKCFVVSLSEA